MTKLHPVALTDVERRQLHDLTRAGSASARRIRRARSLLLADQGLADRRIAAAVGCCVATVENLRRRFAAERLGAVDDRPRPGAAPALDAKGAALLGELARSAPPAGRATWSLRLLAARPVELQVVGAISEETVRRTLKKSG
jgi:transposase